VYSSRTVHDNVDVTEHPHKSPIMTRTTSCAFLSSLPSTQPLGQLKNNTERQSEGKRASHMEKTHGWEENGGTNE